MPFQTFECQARVLMALGITRLPLAGRGIASCLRTEDAYKNSYFLLG
jgi:hypothetical protein